MKSFRGERGDAGGRRRLGRRLPVVVVALAAAAAFAAPALGQPGPAWPDGTWTGAVSGSGAASGNLEGNAGAGGAVASGGFSFAIIDGEAAGGYGVVWIGSGESSQGSGEVRIDESGTIGGEGGQPLLVRQSFEGEVTVDGVTLALPGGSLDPAPTPLIAEHIDCGMVEGYFLGKLSALAASLEAFGVSASAQERFVAFGVDTSDTDYGDEHTAAAGRLGELQTGLVQLTIGATPDNIETTLAELEAILSEAEGLLAVLGGLEGCELLDAGEFRLGLTSAADALITRLFELTDGDAALVEQTAIAAVRSGISQSIVVRERALASITAAVALAEAAEDKAALEQLAVAALTLGFVDEFNRIVAICEEVSS